MLYNSFFLSYNLKRKIDAERCLSVFCLHVPCFDFFFAGSEDISSVNWINHMLEQWKRKHALAWATADHLSHPLPHPLRRAWHVMKQFCMKIDNISQGRENVLFLLSNKAAMTSHENALYCMAPGWSNYRNKGMKTWAPSIPVQNFLQVQCWKFGVWDIWTPCPTSPFFTNSTSKEGRGGEGKGREGKGRGSLFGGRDGGPISDYVIDRVSSCNLPLTCFKTNI